MPRHTKTNPVYASLAYKKAIVQWVSSAVRTRLLGVTDAPPERLLCEDVFPVDAEVPVEELVEYVQQLNEEEARLDLEMNKFEFTRRAHGTPEQCKHRKKQKGKKGGGPEGRPFN